MRIRSNILEMISAISLDFASIWDRVAKPLCFRGYMRLLRLLLQACALQCERNLSGKCFDQVALFRQEQTSPLGRLYGQNAQDTMASFKRQVLRDGAR
jgi:hypothetical protein